MKKTLPIAYPGGAYGTYLEWLINCMYGSIPLTDPLVRVGDNKGSSHLTPLDTHLGGLEGLKKYCDSDIDHLTVRLHPKLSSKENLVDNLEVALSMVDRMILIYPDENSILLTINNYYHKIWTDWWSERFHKEISPSLIYDNWPVDTSVAIEDVPLWVRREFLSYYLMPAWYDQVEWRLTDSWQHPRCLVISVTDLLHRPDYVLEKISDFTEWSWTREFKEVAPIHQSMIDLQQFIDQDRTCKEIIQCLQSGQDLAWSELPLPSQAWVQWKIRESQHEIQCHGLEQFPTNSSQLRTLLYRAK